eukprot:scaffold167_cov347-Prasinococcus_capsulatus_cf.AAC.1
MHPRSGRGAPLRPRRRGRSCPRTSAAAPPPAAGGTRARGACAAAVAPRSARAPVHARAVPRRGCCRRLCRWQRRPCQCHVQDAARPPACTTARASHFCHWHSRPLVGGTPPRSTP